MRCFSFEGLRKRTLQKLRNHVKEQCAYLRTRALVRNGGRSTLLRREAQFLKKYGALLSQKKTVQPCERQSSGFSCSDQCHWCEAFRSTVNALRVLLYTHESTTFGLKIRRFTDGGNLLYHLSFRLNLAAATHQVRRDSYRDIFACSHVTRPHIQPSGAQEINYGR